MYLFICLSVLGFELLVLEKDGARGGGNGKRGKRVVRYGGCRVMGI
jgi:hypothetical protein